MSSRSRFAHVVIVFCLSVGILGSAPAGASPLFELVGGDSGSTGFNGRAGGAGAASTYFNPSLLAHAPAGVSLGVFFLSDQISIRVFNRGSGAADIPTNQNSAVHDGTFENFDTTAFPTDWLENGCPDCPSDLPARPRQGVDSSANTSLYQSFGVVVPVWKRRVVLGVFAMFPFGDFTEATSFYNDEREQHFSNSLHPELYSDRLKAMALAFGFGSQLHDKLSAGVSFTLALQNTASSPNFESGGGSLDDIVTAPDIGVNLALAPHFGVEGRPHERVRLTATAHSPQSLTIDTEFSTTLPTGTRDVGYQSFTQAFVPWSFSAGGEVDVLVGPGRRLSLVGHAKYALWSDYRDRHDEQPHVIDSISRCEFDDEGTNVCTRTSLTFDKYRWSNTFSGAVGARYQRNAFNAFLDLAWEPTPVPPSTGRRNYVDNPRAGVAAGAGYEFTWAGRLMRLGAHTQFHYLISRTIEKNPFTPHPEPNPSLRDEDDIAADGEVIDELPDDAVDKITGLPIEGRDGLQTNNPGWPGFRSDGVIFGGGVSLTVRY